MVTTGIGFTVTIAFTLGLVQLLSVYATEYVVVDAGLIWIELVVSPVDHKYVPFGKFAFALRVAMSPKHMVVLEVDATGIGFTRTVELAVPVHPCKV